MNIELRHLRYFVAVAEQGHFGRAAKRLGIAQPPLSQQIKALEESLGVTLFDRSQRPVALTAPGRYFLAEADAILGRAESAMERTRRVHRGEAGSLVFACGPFAVHIILPRLLPLFHARYPDVDLSIHEPPFHDIAPAVEQQRVDLAFLLESAAPTRMQSEVLLEDPFIAAVPLDHSFADQARIPVQSLAREPFISLARSMGTGYYQYVERAFSLAGFTPHIAHEAGQLQTMFALVAAGYGVALVPQALGWLAGPAVRVLQLDGIDATMRLCMVWNPRNSSPLLAGARETVHEALRSAPHQRQFA
jgi:DNA-binding transcriptional LysR family regulator